MNNNENEGSKIFNKTNSLTDSMKHLFEESVFLSHLREGALTVYYVEFEGQRIPMRLLTIKEQREANIAARQKWLKLDEEVRLPIINFQYEVIEILTRALTIQSDELKVRVNADELDLLSEGQFLTLYQLYEDLEAKYNITPDQILEDDRYEEILDILRKKKAPTNNISRCELEEASRRLISATDTLMDELHTLSSLKSSTTAI